MCILSDTGDGDGVDDVWLNSECETDSDCPMDFTCEEMEVGCATQVDCPPCVDSGCEAGAECPEPTCEPCDPAPTDCTDTMMKSCVYHPVDCKGRHRLPRRLPAARTYSTGGTTCTSCDCACPSEGECPPCECDTEEKCVEEPGVEVGVCVPQEKECAADADCPEGLELQHHGL